MLLRFSVLLALFGAIWLAAAPSHAQRPMPTPKWELLGETRVGFSVERDVISVGQPDAFYRNRSYDRLRLTADRGEVRLRSLRLRYINGFEETLPLERSVRPGASVVVELPGRRSYIAQIEMTHSAEGKSSLFDSWLKPHLRVFGLNSRIGLAPLESGPEPSWILLGENAVSINGTRDVIRLGRDEEWYRTRSFDKLHLVVSEGKIQLETLRILYINGYDETVFVGRDLRAGTDLVVDLPGDRSYLRDIEISYRTRPESAQRAIVKVYGEGR